MVQNKRGKSKQPRALESNYGHDIESYLSLKLFSGVLSGIYE